MAKTSRRDNGRANKATLGLLLNCSLIFLGLGGMTTGTMAWFMSSRTATVEASSFTIVAPSGVEYDLYYLDHFTVSEVTKDGNWNNKINKFAGYEVSYDATYAKFKKVKFDSNGDVMVEEGQPSPTSIEQLWPAHKLTYALVITSGSASSFSLSFFEQTQDETVLTSDNVQVSLTWAIDMRGQIINPSPTENLITDIQTDIQTAYSTYRSSYSSLSDGFGYAETYTEPATAPTCPLSIVSGGATGEVSRQILFFTIEFSNGTGTFYELDSETGKYVKTEDGNSNCYENLRLTNLVFSLS